MTNTVSSVSDTSQSQLSQARQNGRDEHLGAHPTSSGRNTKAQQPTTSNHPRLTSIAQLKERRNSMLAGKSRESRRERTFIGGQCAACDEPLEHTLRGERILSLSCGHVAHEACFYEYIKEFEAQTCPTCNATLGVDTSRGAGIDFENLNRLVRSAQTPDLTASFRDQTTPTPWDTDTIKQNVQTRQRQQQRHTREHLLPERTRSSDGRYDKYNHLHGRHESGDTGLASNNEYAETHQSNGRRHDYDVQSMETTVSAPRHPAKNPIPAPSVTVRSEFPTLSKSRQRQSLTCLVTVEVVDGKWQPNLDDLRSPPPVPATIPEEASTADKPSMNGRNSEHPRAVDSVHEDLQAMEEVKDELYKRVDNWHGQDFSRYGRLLLHGKMRVGKDKQAWQELECYLFTEMLICVKEKKMGANASQQWDGSEGPKPKPRCTLKGSIQIKRHLRSVEAVAGQYRSFARLKECC